MKNSIKTLVALFFAAFILSLTGCKKEPADLIIGSWQELEAVYTETINGETNYPESLLEPGEVVTMTFNKDNTYTSKSVLGDDVNVTSGTWSIVDNKLTFTQDEEELGISSMTFDIELLDKKDMTIVCNESGTQLGITYNINITIKMKRI